MVPGNRNVTLDITRAICAIWIIALWHFRDFIDTPCFNKFILYTLQGEYVTAGVLSCFMFLSGFFLKKYNFFNKKDVSLYASKRFWRFYILLVVAAVLLFLPGLKYIKFITLLTGTSVFLRDQPQTLWFFGDLIFFYILTPVVLWGEKKWKIVFVRSFCIYILILFLYYEFKFDVRVLMYMPCYFAGLLIPNNAIKYFENKYTIIVLSVVVVLIYLLSLNYFILYELVVPFFLIGISSIIARNLGIISYLLQKVAYASMCAYLFHKQLMAFYYYHIGPIKGIWAYVFIMLIFVLSYIAQNKYDMIIRNKLK